MKIRMFCPIRLFCLISLALATCSGFADYTISVPSGLHTIANHLDHGGNTLNEVLPGVPGGTQIQKWNCVGYATYTKGAAGWLPAGGTLKPGEGAFINNPGAPFNVTFTGTPHVPVLPPPLPCGCGNINFLSAQTTNSPSTFEDILGFPPPDFTEVWVWNNGQWSVTTFFSGFGWDNFVPALQLGESAMFNIPACSTAPSLTCATNKTVDDCSPWSFDPPTTIVANCYTNHALTSTTVTNSGPCPLVTTRTWLITDICGNTNTCSQTVTVDCCTNCSGCTANNVVSLDVSVNANITYYLVNPLCTTNNTLGALLPNVPPGTIVRKWNGGYTTYQFDPDDLIWTPDGNATLNPGEGFTLQSPSAFTLTWTGCIPICPPPCLPRDRRAIRAGWRVWPRLRHLDQSVQLPAHLRHKSQHLERHRLQ